MTLINYYQSVIKKSQVMSWIPSLLFRLILAPVMIIAGYSELGFSESPEAFLQAITASLLSSAQVTLS